MKAAAQRISSVFFHGSHWVPCACHVFGRSTNGSGGEAVGHPHPRHLAGQLCVEWREPAPALADGNFTCLESLGWLHLAEGAEDTPVFGLETALVTHAADLRRSHQNECDADCPLRGGSSHHHFLVNIGRGFLGILGSNARPVTMWESATINFRLAVHAQPVRISNGLDGRVACCRSMCRRS